MQACGDGVPGIFTHGNVLEVTGAGVGLVPVFVVDHKAYRPWSNKLSRNQRVNGSPVLMA